MNRQQTITTYPDIDWHLLWQSARAKKSWKSKGSKDWDKKAGSFSERNKQSPYISLFLSHLKLTPDMTVLDVGCGPGTLALPIAKMVREVVALDYSDGMLESLTLQAQLQGVTNIRAIKCAWEDDWQEKKVGVHDIAIASRSMNIDNLADGILKLDNHASNRVFISDRIEPSPFDPDAFRAIGREFNSGPDYIYTVNILYGLGIHPNINHIELASELGYKNIDEALDAYKWMFRDLSSVEEKRLKAFLESRIIRKGVESVVIKRRFPQRWALIWWEKEKKQ